MGDDAEVIYFNKGNHLMDIQLRTATVKQQSIWAVLGLTLITFGIYGLFWYHRVNREMRDIGAAYGDAQLAASNPTNSVLALLFGGMALFIPVIITLNNTAKRIRQTEAATGMPVSYSVGVHWLLAIFTGLWPLYAQSTLNTVWTAAQVADGSTAATAVAA